ncbi:FecR family protein [Sinomicrobium soli]|uniref:FecR family protein n=1 Tax=Sinomicrobium sp. N-1-3-6 TaxID=2219864 RepID=UPI000DCF4A4A|nr:FecR domain-containing protein [Sinomicrobium sp. N-1-3-6]RAV30500.1 hypothetical protein DN748_03105 [Sinomicrobium sp. N-1-3-6]
MIPVDKKLLERYHQGKCNEAEAHAVKRWLESSDAGCTYPAHGDMDALQRRSWIMMKSRISYEQVLVEKRRKRRNFLVAGMTAIMAITLFLWFPQSNPEWKIVQSPDGERKQLTLEDGTEVWLNSGSTLKYPEHFGEDKRNVFLEGEAYFRVAHNRKKPFNISSERSTVEVLGTEFNLKAYKEEAFESVVVSRGKVRFSDKRNGKSVVLEQNERGILDRNAIAPEKETVRGDRYGRWKDNILVFDDTTLGELSAILKRWYGIRVDIEGDGLMGLRYTGEFEQPRLQEVVHSLCFAMELTYTYNNRVLTLYKNRPE